MLSASQNISIVLPGSVPFGFKMQGGREYRAPLTILSVSAGSKAFTQGLRDGDVLLKINSSVTHNLEHTEAMKLIKTAKGGLNLTLTRVTSTREEALQAMKQFSEEMEVPPPPLEHTDSVSLLPPPPADLEPPPPAELDLPPPPSLDMADLPPPPPEDDLPPAPPDTVEVAAPPAAPPAPPAPAKPAAAPPSKVPLGKLTPATPPGTPPTVALKPADMSYRPSRKASLDIPKSALTQFGEEVISIAHSRENSGDTNMAAVPRSGKFFKLLQSQLDEMKDVGVSSLTRHLLYIPRSEARLNSVKGVSLSDDVLNPQGLKHQPLKRSSILGKVSKFGVQNRRAGTDTLPKYTFPGYNISPAPADGTKSPELAPCPTPATPATPATPPAVAPKPSNVQKSSASFNLMSMAYSPSPTKSPSQPPTFFKSPSLTSISSTSSTESSTKTPTSTTKTPTSTIKTPTSSKFITPPSFTSNSEDMKKKFETLDLNNSKFKNKGSFFNKYNITPESPTPPPVPAVTTPPTTPPTAAKPQATPSTPVSAPSSGGVKSAGPTLILKSNPSSPASSNPSTRSNSPGSKGGAPQRTTSKQSPVRPAVRPITPPPDDNSTGNIANGTAIKPAPTVKPASTCTSPLPKFQNSDTPPLLSRQGSRSSVNQTPVKPRMVSLVDDSPPDPDTEEVTKQSPSLSKLMFGSGNPPAPTFNSPDRGYNRAAATNGAASHPVVTPSPSNGSVTPSNGSVTSPTTLGSTTEAPTTPKTSNGGTVNGGITPGGTANGGSSPGDNAKGGKKSLFTSNPILLPICKSCHQEIRGPYVGAQGRAWHSEHFVCTVCDGDLSQGFKEVDEKLFCGTCYFERFGEKCANCGKTCVGSVIQALGKSYHPEHFTCFECGNVLKEGFNVDNGNPYCSACHTNFLPLCAGCNKRIEGATQWISALEKDWHNGCFACGVCRAPLAGSSFYHDGQGKALCQVHARAASRPVA